MRPLERPRRIWKDNIQTDFKEIGINTRNWGDSAQDRDYCRALVNAALYSVPNLSVHFVNREGRRLHNEELHSLHHVMT